MLSSTFRFFFFFVGVYATFCPIDIDRSYQGFRANNGRCVTLVDQDMIEKKELEQMTYNTAELNCSRYFTNGNLFAFKTSFSPHLTGNTSSSITYSFKHALPLAKSWRVYRDTRLLNGVKMVQLDASTQGELIHATLHLEYSNRTKEKLQIKMSHGYNIITSGHRLGIDLLEQPFLATAWLSREICFTIDFPLSDSTKSRQYSLNRPRDCFAVSSFNAYLCESDPMDWCTVKEISANGADKLCQCARGKKKTHCSSIPCKKSESWMGGKGAKCISPELVEIDEKAQIDMSKWHIIYGSISFLIIVVLVGIVLLVYRKKKKKLAKAAKTQEAEGDKARAVGTNLQVALDSNMASQKTGTPSPAELPGKSGSGSQKSSRSPSPAKK